MKTNRRMFLTAAALAAALLALAGCPQQNDGIEKPAYYTVTLDPQGGSGGTGSVTVAYDRPLPSITPPAKTGLVFGGYFTETEGKGAKYYNSEGKSAKYWDKENDATLYAKWGEFSLTYHNLDGTESWPNGENPDAYNTSGTPIILQDPERTGYLFKGWFADPAFSVPAASIPAFGVGNREFWAKWIAVYTIAYDGNGYTSGPSTVPAEQTKIEGTALTLRTNDYENNQVEGEGSLTRTGYLFDRWNTKADGTGANYEAGEVLIGDLTTEGGVTVPVDSDHPVKGGVTATLYAKWKGITYYIVYDGNGATEGDVPPEQAKIYGTPLDGGLYEYDYNDLAYGSKFFAEWNTLANGTGTTYKAGANLAGVDLTTTPEGEVTLYAVWKDYQITYYPEGEANVAGNPDAYNVADLPITTLLDPTKEGYHFDGWFTDEDRTTEAGTPAIPAGSTGNKEFWAKWTAQYTITYNANGGAGALPADQTKIVGTDLTLRKNNGETGEGSLTSTGYGFSGWNTLANGMGTDYLPGATVGTDDLTTTPGATVILYAKWTPKYTIKYDANGGTGTPPAEQEKTTGGLPVTLPKNDRTTVDGFYQGGFTKANSNFGGWNTLANGRGYNYPPGGTLTGDLDYQENAGKREATLYAVWGRYKITYVLDGGIHDVRNPLVYNVPLTTGITLFPPTKPATSSATFTFDGWFTDAAFTTAAGTPAIPAGSTGNKTFYAKWTSSSAP